MVEFFYIDYWVEAVIFSPFSLEQFRGKAQLMELPTQARFNLKHSAHLVLSLNLSPLLGARERAWEN
jgi:hypothetical protein